MVCETCGYADGVCTDVVAGSQRARSADAHTYEFNARRQYVWGLASVGDPAKSKTKKKKARPSTASAFMLLLMSLIRSASKRNRLIQALVKLAGQLKTNDML